MDLLCWQLIDVLGCELEVAHRYFEGKYEALRILQGKVQQHTKLTTAPYKGGKVNK